MKKVLHIFSHKIYLKKNNFWVSFMSYKCAKKTGYRNNFPLKSSMRTVIPYDLQRDSVKTRQVCGTALQYEIFGC